MGNLSFCFKLFSLSNMTKTVIWLRAKKNHWRETRDILTCFSWFPDHIWFLVERHGWASGRSWNKHTFSPLYSPAAAGSRCSSLRDTKMLLILKLETLEGQRNDNWAPFRENVFQLLEVMNYTKYNAYTIDQSQACFCLQTIFCGIFKLGALQSTGKSVFLPPKIELDTCFQTPNEPENTNNPM